MWYIVGHYQWSWMALMIGERLFDWLHWVSFHHYRFNLIEREPCWGGKWQNIGLFTKWTPLSFPTLRKQENLNIKKSFFFHPLAMLVTVLPQCELYYFKKNRGYYQERGRTNKPRRGLRAGRSACWQAAHGFFLCPHLVLTEGQTRSPIELLWTAKKQRIL